MNQITEEDEKKVFQVFTHRIGQRISREFLLQEVFGIIITDREYLNMDSHDRMIRKHIESLRLKGFPIVSTSSDAGYVMTDDPEQIDACIAELVARSNIAFAGVDAVAADGTVFNKTGTYLTALAAREFGVPFYFATDTLKFDTATLLGLPFRNEAVPLHDVLGDKKYTSGVCVSGNLFDTTPPRLITAIVTELGVIPPTACINVMWNMKLSRRISELIPAWVYGKL